MVVSRRAAMSGPTPALLAGVKAALTVLSAALAVALSALAFVIAAHGAPRRDPGGPRSPTPGSSRSTRPRRRSRSARTPDTELPGQVRPVHERDRELRQTRLGAGRGRDQRQAQAPHAHRHADAHLRGRRLQRLVLRPRRGAAPARSRPSSSARPSGRARRGSSPPATARSGSSRCTGAAPTRAECLRAVPVFHALGITSLVVSYRNDGEAPRSRAGTYALGATEWRDVDAAVGFARRRGARRIVLMGWSMGGAIALQLELNSAHRDVIAGLILESPVIDWRVVLGYQAKLLRLPRGRHRTRDRRPADRMGDADDRCRSGDPVRPARRGLAGRRAAASDSDPAQRRRRLRAVGRVPRPRRRPAGPGGDAGVRGRPPHEAVELRPGAVERQHPPLARAAGPDGCQRTADRRPTAQVSGPLRRDLALRAHEHARHSG